MHVLNRTVAICFISSLTALSPLPAAAELTGTDRTTFIEGFIRGCVSSDGSAEVVRHFGGGTAELRRYCACVAQVYARNLNPDDTPRNMAARRLDAIEKTSRDFCLDHVFGK